MQGQSTKAISSEDQCEFCDLSLTLPKVVVKNLLSRGASFKFEWNFLICPKSH